MGSRIAVTGPIVPETFDHIVAKTEGLFGHSRCLDSPVFLFISSRGGDTDISQRIFEYLRTLPAPVITFGLGSVDSAAVIIFCAGDERVLTTYSQLYIHAPTHKIHSVGHYELLRRADNLKRLGDRDIAILRAVTGQSEETVKQWHENGCSFSPGEAIEVGLATQVVELTQLRHSSWPLIV